MQSLVPGTSSTALANRQIYATRVPRHRRAGFLPRVFGPASCAEGESRIYDWMRRLSPDYTGGSWEFYELSNQGFFMAPQASACATHDGRPSLLIRCDEGNGYEGILSPEASGIVATTFALNHMLFGGHHHLEDAYFRLIDYIAVHPECIEIRRAID